MSTFRDILLAGNGLSLGLNLPFALGLYKLCPACNILNLICAISNTAAIICLFMKEW
jgi:hypothetical protein